MQWDVHFPLSTPHAVGARFHSIHGGKMLTALEPSGSDSTLTYPVIRVKSPTSLPRHTLAPVLQLPERKSKQN